MPEAEQPSPDVVVSVSSFEETTQDDSSTAVVGQGSLERRLPHALYQQLIKAGIKAPWRLAVKYDEPSIRQALELLGEAKHVRNPAGFLVTALNQGWAPKEKHDQIDVLREETQQRIAAMEVFKREAADPERSRRSHLARLAARCSPSLPMALRRSPTELMPELERLELSLGDLENYMRENAGIMEAGKEGI